MPLLLDQHAKVLVLNTPSYPRQPRPLCPGSPGPVPPLGSPSPPPSLAVLLLPHPFPVKLFLGGWVGCCVPLHLFIPAFSHVILQGSRGNFRERSAHLEDDTLRCLGARLRATSPGVGLWRISSPLQTSVSFSVREVIREPPSQSQTLLTKRRCTKRKH